MYHGNGDVAPLPHPFRTANHDAQASAGTAASLAGADREGQRSSAEIVLQPDGSRAVRGSAISEAVITRIPLSPTGPHHAISAHLCSSVHLLILRRSTYRLTPNAFAASSSCLPST